MPSEQSDLDLIENPQTQNPHNDKAHPWRICPIGKHYVKTHSLHIPPSKEHPEGQMVTRHEHCAENPSHKDELSYDEIQHITKTYFSSLEGPPTPALLTKDFDKADHYDTEIRGWVQYWNDIFRLDDPLDPNLIKALIATESSSEERPKKITKAKKIL